MALLTTVQVRRHVETDISDSALGRIVDAAEALIERDAGPTSGVVENFDAYGFSQGQSYRIWTTRAISQITSIKEREERDDTTITLSANDYRQVGSRELVRLRDGDNPRAMWAQFVEVMYDPVVDTNLRVEVMISLVRVMLNFQGFESEKIGTEFSVTHLAKDEAIRQALSPIHSSNRMLLR